MKGKHVIKVYDNRVRYEFSVRRNITVIRGDSATGKTTLLEMLDLCVRLGKESGITMECDVPVDVYMADDRRTDWKKRLEENEGSIVFIEEMNSFVKTKEFAEYVSHSDSYYVLITRWNLKNLPYSVEEVYKLTEKGRYPNTKQIYNGLEQYYSLQHDKDNLNILEVIVEDSGAGYEFFMSYTAQSEVICESADGNSNVLKCLRQAKGGALCIVDGAAFGGFIDECVQYMKFSDYENVIWYPESFEYVLLKAGLAEVPHLNDILENTWNYVDSKVYLTWERFFTSVLVGHTKDTEMAYGKSKLNEYYLSMNAKNKIEKNIPDRLLHVLKG